MPALALEPTFPQPIANDHDDVRCALTVAEASWKRGSMADAAKWLRRAAKAAADADDVLRAVDLSKAAAGLVPDQVAADDDPADHDHKSGERRSAPRPSQPSSRPASSRPPVLRSGFAPKRASRRASRPVPSPRPSAPPLRSRPAPSRPSSAAPRRPSAPASRPVPRAVDNELQRRDWDEATTKRRRDKAQPAIPPPPPQPRITLPDLVDDDDEAPTVILPREDGPVSAPRPSEPIALQARAPASTADRSSVYPSSPGLAESFEEDTIRDRGRLHPPVRKTEPSSIPLSAARVAVLPAPRGGKPDIFFLPFGAVAPRGAVTAMLVTTNARDAARLAELMTAATE
jgi:hypothetical protein